MVPRSAVGATLLVAIAGLMVALIGAGGGGADRAAAAVPAPTPSGLVARVPGTVPAKVRQRNGLLRTSVRLKGSASTVALTRKVVPLTAAQRRRFARRLAGVNPPPSGPVTERDTLVPPLGAESAPADATVLGGGGPAASLAVGDVTVFRNTIVAHGADDGRSSTSNVAEPTVANDRNGLLFTSNWISRVSSDNGMTWADTLDPIRVWATLPRTPATAPGFCCDQTAHAVDHDGGSMVFWVMQGLVAETDNPPGNALVLSVFRGKDDLIDATGINDFCAYPLVAADFGLPADNNFDFPQVSSTDRYLYISVNVGKGRNKNTSFALVMRFRLDDLDDGDCLADPVAWSDTRTKENLIPVQDAEDEMFFATHHRDANIFRGDQLRIYSIRDSSGTMETKNVNITDFAPQARDHECVVRGLNICGKSDGRVITGYEAGDTVGWLWTAAQDNNHPFPYVRVAAFDDDTLELVGERDIFNRSFALNTPAVGVNQDNEVGLTLYQMGGSSLPALWATVVDDPRNWNDNLEFRVPQTSTDLPATGEWGDYAKVFPYDNCDRTFAAGAWSVEGSGPFNAAHRFIWFGKEGDGCIDLQLRDLTFIPALGDNDGYQRGDTFLMSGVIRNSGSADAPASTIRYFLSRNRKIGPEDDPITANIPVPPIAFGEQAILNGVVSDPIPESLRFSDGEYYVVACADDADVIEEITDTNNCYLETAQVLTIDGGAIGTAEPLDRGDYAFDPVDISDRFGGGSGTASFNGQVAPGAILRADETVRHSSATLRTSTPPVRYHLSRAPMADDDDAVALRSTRLGTVRRTRVRNRTTFRVTRRLVVPRRIAPGRWYLVACLAPPRGQDDRRTANDCHVRRVPIVVSGAVKAPLPRRRVADRR